MRFAKTEVAALRELLSQFLELLDSGSVSSDPALGRLAPRAYHDDEHADREFRRLTEGDLMTRRRTDAETVNTSLGTTDTRLEVVMDEQEAETWMRTLSAMRLVLAERLGITSDDAQHAHDPNYGVYEWLGYRLELLVDAFD